VAQNVTLAEQTQSQGLVWGQLETLFRPLPSDADFDEMFSVMKRIPQEAPPPALIRPHWSDRIRRIAEQSGVRPPPELPKETEIAKYWTRRTVNFPIEAIQKRKTSMLHYLLSSFVELDEDERPGRTDPPLFVRVHPLIPEMHVDGWLGLPFETRLSLELESLGLNSPEPEKFPNSIPFQSEIVDYVYFMNDDTLPKLRKLEPLIRDNIEKFRKKEKKMNDTIRETKQRLADLKKKGPKK
jgi:hypothetical protein